MTKEELLDKLETELREKSHYVEDTIGFCNEHNFSMEQKALEYKLSAYNDVFRIIRQLRKDVEIENKYPLKEVEIEFL